MIQALGYTGLAPNYLSIPCYVLTAIAPITWTTLSHSNRLQKRGLFAFLASNPCIIGYAIAVGTPSPVAGYAAMFLCATGIYPYNAIMFTWLLNNLSPDWKRFVRAPLFASLSNVSGVISSQIYPPSGSLGYLMGNFVSLAMKAVACSGVGLLWLVLRRMELGKERIRKEGVGDDGYGCEESWSGVSVYLPNTVLHRESPALCLCASLPPPPIPLLSLNPPSKSHHNPQTHTHPHATPYDSAPHQPQAAPAPQP